MKELKLNIGYVSGMTEEEIWREFAYQKLERITGTRARRIEVSEDGEVVRVQLDQRALTTLMITEIQKFFAHYDYKQAVDVQPVEGYLELVIS